MGGGKSSETTIGFKYFMSIHMGIGRGPIDSIEQINIGDKQAWPKAAGQSLVQPPITDDMVNAIDAEKLFGGDKKEGGVKGSLTVLMGKATQIVPAWIVALLGGRVPAFRGVTTLFFDGEICAMNPYPKVWRFRVRRALKGWDGDVWLPDLAKIVMFGGKIHGMNPAHILYECATNRDWGRGFPRSRLGPTWAVAAQTLFDEGFGLCLRWNRQETLQNFIKTVINHIGGATYVDRTTGLIELSLIRDDYDIDDLPLFDYNSGLLEVVDSETVSRESAVNEIIVKYQSPILDESREVRAQNLASIQTLGAINSATRDYVGIPTHDLAGRIAQRDLRVETASGQRYKVTLDRSGWRVRPGSVFRISAPDKGIDNLVLRAGNYTDGPLTSGQISVDAVIDVFGLSEAAYTTEQGSEWTPPDTAPMPSPYRAVREATYLELAREMSPADLAIVHATAGRIATVAVKPNNMAFSYQIASRTGSDPFVSRGSGGSWAPAVILTGAIGRYSTSADFNASFDIGLIEVGNLMQIGNEIVQLDAITVSSDGQSGTLTIARGCVDTIPASHSAGSVAFALDDATGTDDREYASGETVDVKLLTETSTSVLDETLAPTNTVSIVARQGRPYPPANVKVNGVPCFNSGTVVTGNVPITWAHRDRIIQLDQIFSHTDSDIGPETGVTYTLRFYNGTSGALISTVSGITANSLVYTAVDLVGLIRAELESVRDGIASLQKYSFSFTRNL